MPEFPSRSDPLQKGEDDLAVLESFIEEPRLNLGSEIGVGEGRPVSRLPESLGAVAEVWKSERRVSRPKKQSSCAGFQHLQAQCLQSCHCGRRHWLRSCQHIVSWAVTQRRKFLDRVVGNNALAVQSRKGGEEIGMQPLRFKIRTL